MALDPATYPRLRRQRAGPTPTALVPTAPGAPAAPPRTRIFPFSIDADANTRTSVSSPRLKGPAIVRAVHVAKGGAAGGLQGWGLGVAANAIEEGNVANAVAKPFRTIFEGLPNPTGVSASPGNTTLVNDLQGAVLQDADDLGLIILDAEFFLVVYVSIAGVGGNVFGGYVVVLEQVSPQALANFL